MKSKIYFLLKLTFLFLFIFFILYAKSLFNKSLKTYDKTYNTNISVNSASNIQNSEQLLIPTKINIGQSDITIIKSTYNPKTKQLNVPDEAAAWLQGSAAINQKGATLIYGHNSDKIFKFLNEYAIGYTIKITDQNNKKYTYKNINQSIVEPNQTDVLYNLEGREEDLILITCTESYFNSKRLISFFKKID